MRPGCRGIWNRRILARLALIAQGVGSQADPALVDELLIAGAIQAAVADEKTPLSTRDPAELRAKVRGESACDRILDVLLRAGPYGDGFGATPNGLSLETGTRLGSLMGSIKVARSGPQGIELDLAEIQARYEKEFGERL